MISIHGEELHNSLQPAVSTPGNGYSGLAVCLCSGPEDQVFKDCKNFCFHHGSEKACGCSGDGNLAEHGHQCIIRKLSGIFRRPQAMADNPGQHRLEIFGQTVVTVI